LHERGRLAIKAIIVDDEELARNRLANLIAELDHIELCGTFGTAAAALQYVEEKPVDVVFLDISMPEMDGMEFANILLEQGSTVKVVFVTGYEEYAVEAFELEAVDYLLKPISRERLAKTVNRLIKPQKSKEQRLFVSCFGGFSVSLNGDNGEVISWRSPKVEELFAFLICKGSVSRDEIADTLWDGFAPDKALKNINSTVYYIRKALQQYGMENCLITTHRQIKIDSKKLFCDLYEFERLQKGAWNTMQTLEKLNELYQGELFQGKIYEWSFAKAHALEESLIYNLLKSAEQLEDQEQYEKAQCMYVRVLELNPFNEKAGSKLLSIYRKSGNHQKALQLTQQMEQILSEETAESALKPMSYFLRKRL
jgi:two-component SAPR family response regulator